MRTDSFRLLLDLTRREYRLRYLGSVLGSYWNVIHPLVMILIFTTVFSKVMKARMGEGASGFSYSHYLCSGLLAWNFFSEIVNRSAVCLLDNAAFLKKVPFPTYILFVATALSASVNFLISFAIFVIFSWFFVSISFWQIGIFLLLILPLALFGVALGSIVGCLNVFMRDFQQVTMVLFQMWFWFTPIVYLQDVLPEDVKPLLKFNPAWSFIEPLHQVLFFGKIPDWEIIATGFGWCALGVGIATLVYRRTILLVRDQL